MIMLLICRYRGLKVGAVGFMPAFQHKQLGRVHSACFVHDSKNCISKIRLAQDIVTAIAAFGGDADTGSLIIVKPVSILD
jgi:hypothetical protein